MALRKYATLLLTIVVDGCGASRLPAQSTAVPAFTVHTIALPGSSSAGASMDGLAYDLRHHRVWAPAGNTGSVDVVDVTNDRVSRIEGFATAEVERNGTKRTVGPSSAAVGDGVVYVGNRGDSGVCAIGAASLELGSCVRLDSPPDALAYIATRMEVWVTTPHDNSIVILDAAAGRPSVLCGACTASAPCVPNLGAVRASLNRVANQGDGSATEDVLGDNAALRTDAVPVVLHVDARPERDDS